MTTEWQLWEAQTFSITEQKQRMRHLTRAVLLASTIGTC